MEDISAEHPVLLVGAGKMGGAMLAGWLKERPGDHFHILDPVLADDMRTLCETHGVPVSTSLPESVSPFAVILAVKPQMMETVLPTLESLAACRPVFVSIAAGTSVARFKSTFGDGAAIVRCMPNTPAQVGRGITIGYPTSDVSAIQKEAVASLLAVTGAFDWVDRESLIDAVTAVSGSGPAYVFHMVEALAQAAEGVGLPSELALRLARATVEGAGELLYQSDLDAATLRQNVTSPGGTTAAALAVLMADDGLPPLMQKAVVAARDRAEELGRD